MSAPEKSTKEASRNQMARPIDKAVPPLIGGDRVALLQTALEHMDEGFTVYDEQLQLLAWNERFFTLLDLPRSLAYIGAPFIEFMRFNAERGEYGPGDPGQLVQERVGKALLFVPHVFERTRPDGTVLEVRGNPIPGVGFVTVYKDITEQKAAERALKESVDTLEQRVGQRTAELETAAARMKREIAERKRALETLEANGRWIRLVTDAVPAVIGYADSGRVFRFANRHYEKWFATTVNSLVGQRVDAVFPRPLYPGHFQDLEAALSGQHITREYRLEKPDGRQIDVVMDYLPHFDNNGRVIGYFILGQDITERKQTEHTLRQAEKMQAVGQLTGGLAHDFNNLLTIVIGNLALLQDFGTLADQDREMIDEAVGAARLGADLVKRLLAFSGRKPLRSQVYDPKKVIVWMHALLARTLGDDITLSIQLSGEDWSIDTDPSELENALLNMALNSRDAITGGGQLTISVATCHIGAPAPDGLALEPGDYVKIEVSDTGCGMTNEIKERAFEPFFTSKGPGGGTGLGLSTVYGFAQRSGGAARIDSMVGRGTSVALYLPRHPEKRRAAPRRKRRVAKPVLATGRILLVEDDAKVRAFVLKSLIALGYDVADVANGRLALDALAADSGFNLLLTDMEMPGGISGLDLALEVEAKYPAIRVLMVSGYPDRVFAGHAGLNPQWHFLPKPFEPDELARAVQDALSVSARSRTARANGGGAS